MCGRIETTKCCLYKILFCCFKRQKRLRQRDVAISNLAENRIAVTELPIRNPVPDRRNRFVSTEIVSMKKILQEHPKTD